MKLLNDPPTGGQLFHDERVKSSRHFLVQLQGVAAFDQGVASPQHLDGLLAERQLTHFFTFALVLLLVAVEGRLPALGLGVAGEKAQVL